MQTGRASKYSLCAAIGLVFLTSACGPAFEYPKQSITAEQTACQPNQAQIMVQDSFQEVLCGCQEAAGTVVAQPSALTCTVPLGTTVFFQFLGIQYNRQLGPRNNSDFPPTLLINPEDSSSPRAFPIQFGTAGSYPYQDLFNNGLNGTIVVI